MKRLNKVDSPIARRTLRKVNPIDLKRLEAVAIKVRYFLEINRKDYSSYVKNVGVRKPPYDENPPVYGVALYMVPGRKLPMDLAERIEKVTSGERVFQCESREDFRFGAGI